MILFDLRCSHGHGFEAWFRDSASYKRLAAAGEISCAVCGERNVEKALMAPSVRTNKSAAPPPAIETGSEPKVDDATAPSASSENGSGASHEGTDLPSQNVGPENLAQAMRVLRQAQDHIQKNFEHVGKAFPEEARKIHYGETEKRSIYGEATQDEAKTLADEGIEVGQIPWLPSHNS